MWRLVIPMFGNRGDEGGDVGGAGDAGGRKEGSGFLSEKLSEIQRRLQIRAEKGRMREGGVQKPESEGLEVVRRNEGGEEVEMEEGGEEVELEDIEVVEAVPKKKIEVIADSVG